MVEPSGIVVVPLNPFGPDVTLLDMRPDKGGLEDLVALWTVDLDDRDVAFAVAVEEALSFASAQALLAWPFAGSAWVGNEIAIQALMQATPSDASVRRRDVVGGMGLLPLECAFALMALPCRGKGHGL